MTREQIEGMIDAIETRLGEPDMQVAAERSHTTNQPVYDSLIRELERLDRQLAAMNTKTYLVETTRDGIVWTTQTITTDQPVTRERIIASWPRTWTNADARVTITA